MFSPSFYVLTPMNNAKQKCYFCFFTQWLYRFMVVMLTLQDPNSVTVKTYDTPKSCHVQLSRSSLKCQMQVIFLELNSWQSQASL